MISHLIVVWECLERDATTRTSAVHPGAFLKSQFLVDDLADILDEDLEADVVDEKLLLETLELVRSDEDLDGDTAVACYAQKVEAWLVLVRTYQVELFLGVARDLEALHTWSTKLCIFIRPSFIVALRAFAKIRGIVI